MRLRVAFVGFRHAHILGLYKLVQRRDDTEVAAACEEDAETRAGLDALDVRVTHDSYRRMLEETSCDVIACGDYFAIRGQRVLDALRAGRHVISDKPLCTSLEQWTAIQAESIARNLRVGCMLDLGNLGPFVTLRDLLQRGIIGEVHTITFLGQHPLLYGKRPLWNFDPGKHGGTLNDIAVHGIDIIPWLTNRRIVEISAARAWNANVPQHPCFQDGAVLMLRLDNNGAAIGDVSYLSSDRHGYQMPPYWRFTLAGADGVAETACNEPVVRVWRHDRDDVIEQRVVPNRDGAYFDEFLADLRGLPVPDGLHTARVLESTRIALLTQQAADTGTAYRPVNLLPS